MLEINILYLIISYIVCTHLKYIFVYPNDYHYCYYNTYYFYILVSINKKTKQRNLSENNYII